MFTFHPFAVAFSGWCKLAAFLQASLSCLGSILAFYMVSAMAASGLSRVAFVFACNLYRLAFQVGHVLFSMTASVITLTQEILTVSYTEAGPLPGVLVQTDTISIGLSKTFCLSH